MISKVWSSCFSVCDFEVEQAGLRWWCECSSWWQTGNQKHSGKLSSAFSSRTRQGLAGYFGGSGMWAECANLAVEKGSSATKLCWALSDKSSWVTCSRPSRTSCVLVTPFLVMLVFLDHWPHSHGPKDSKLPGPLETTWVLPFTPSIQMPLGWTGSSMMEWTVPKGVEQLRP